MFERGVAAARGGQRRLAAGLLARTVQLDPRHEHGWLWLSGVLDDPKEIAFCLRSVLELNPQNERARQGLAWLEQRELIAATPPAPAAPKEPPPADEPTDIGDEVESWWERARRARAAFPRRDPVAEELHARHHGESWWVNWRRSRRELSRARLVFWMAPLVLLMLTLTLNSLLRTAIDRNAAIVAEAAAAPATIAEEPQRAELSTTILQPDLAPMRDAEVLAYLSALEAPRAELRDAVQSYRNATSQPGGSSIAHASVARRLSETLAQAHETIAALDPPPTLAQAHAAYLTALEQEQTALDDMLNFYSSFSIELANRAVLTMDDASSAIRRANQAFARAHAQIDAPAVTPHVLQ